MDAASADQLDVDSLTSMRTAAEAKLLRRCRCRPDGSGAGAGTGTGTGTGGSCSGKRCAERRRCVASLEAVLAPFDRERDPLLGKGRRHRFPLSSEQAAGADRTLEDVFLASSWPGLSAAEVEK